MGNRRNDRINNSIFNFKNTNRKHMIDTKKILPQPENGFEAIEMMSINGQHLIDAIFIMQSIIDFPKETRVHKKRMKEFIKQFEVE